MKVHSLLGQKEVPWQGTSYMTDENDDVDVPAEAAGKPPKGDDPGSGLLAQVDAWAPVKGKSDKEGDG